MVGTFLRHLVLSYVRKVAELEPGSKSVNNLSSHILL